MSPVVWSTAASNLAIKFNCFHSFASCQWDREINEVTITSDFSIQFTITLKLSDTLRQHLIYETPEGLLSDRAHLKEIVSHK